MIVMLYCLSGFAWRTGMRGVLVIRQSYRLEKLGQGVEVTHRLSCSGLFSWLGYPFFRRACRIFLTRSNEALERHFRKRSVQSRYARPSGRHGRSEEHTSELQSLMRLSYAVFCLQKTKTTQST